MKQAAIIGGTGYGALELIRLLEVHPEVNTAKIISRSEEGIAVAERYPHLAHIVLESFESIESASVEEIDIVFFATPPGVAKSMLPKMKTSGVQYIDLSGDLRIDDGAEYQKWYQLEPPEDSLQKEAVYGLTELYRNEVKQAQIISNPGCFATAAVLALAPMLAAGKIQQESIIIDGKTGVSGAGRKTSLMTHFSETNENVKAYKAGAHQHTPEIEQQLKHVSGKNVFTTLQTHLIPMTRGIMCTSYATLNNTDGIEEAFQDYYQEDPFVRIRKPGNMPQTKEVYGSNYCDIGFHIDERTNRIVIVSVIDNLVKGASGQAIQNMNLMNGWEETSALSGIPLYP